MDDNKKTDEGIDEAISVKEPDMNEEKAEPASSVQDPAPSVGYAHATNEPAPVSETVTVSSEAFNAMMQRLSDLEETTRLQLQVTDKNKIKRIEELRRSGKLVKEVKIRKYAGKYIIGWKTIKDEVYKDENGRLVEKQIIELWFDDGTKSEMSMRQWASAPEYIKFEVKSETKDEDGNLFFKCVGPDGKELELNVSFIN